MSAEADAKFAREQGFLVIDFRRPKAGEKYVFGGMILTALVDHGSRDRNHVIVQEVVTKYDWSLADKPSFKLNDIVRVESAAAPSWNGLARVVRIIEHLPDYVHVVPLDGEWKGVAGSFHRDKLTLVVSSVPETVEEVFAPDADVDKAYNTKATNPKDEIGSSKLPLHLWPETATIGGCLALLDGALKYGRGNWRQAGVRYSVYADALDRHVKAAFEGEDVDPESGLPHEWHALACLAIIVDAKAAGKLVDDRQFPGGYREMVEAATPHVDRLKTKHAHRSPRHWTIADVVEEFSGSE